MDLKPGCIYLTYGTVEQIVSLYPDSELIYKPDTQALRTIFEQHNPFGATSQIIWPKSLTMTGQIKKTGEIKNVKDSNIPTDQFLRVHPDNLIFIPFIDITGTVLYKTEAKKIEGGPFKILDLRPQFSSPYPSAELYKKNICRDVSYETDSFCIDMIKSLTTVEGAQKWGSLRTSDIYRWLCVPEQEYIPITSSAKAWCLEPYLRPFLNLSKQRYHLNTGGYLSRFAYWVYLATHKLDNPRDVGLSSYASRNGQKIYSFRPSKRAKDLWLRWIENKCYLARIRRK